MEIDDKLDNVPIIVRNTVKLENKYMIQGIDMMRTLIVLDEENKRIKKQLNYEIQEELKQSEIMLEKQQEIESLKSQLDFIEEQNKYINKLERLLQQKENIIKEVREHLQETINKWEDYEQFYEVVVEDKYILEILDKESKQ